MRALPMLWLLTDERIDTASLLRAAGRLPRGSGIILRHYRTPEAERRALFDRLRQVARRNCLMLLLAGTVGQALRWGADGAHGRAATRAPVPRGFVRSAPVHDMAELREAARGGANIVFVSPLFATRSHPGAAALGAFRFAALARAAPMPVMALGGVGSRHRQLIRRLGASGHGAIDSLTRRQNLNDVPT